MLNFVNRKMLNIFEKNNLNYDEELIKYALIIISRYTICILLSAIVAIKLNMLINFLVFLINFYFLRIHFGGFHFESNNKCLILSVLILVVFPYTSTQLLISRKVIIIISIILSILLYEIGPRETKNKKLELSEIKYHLKKGMKILFLDICLILIISNVVIVNAIFFSVVLEFINVIIPFIFCKKKSLNLKRLNS